MVQKLVNIAEGQYLEAELNQVLDSTGMYSFSPESLAQSFAYANGKLQSVTAGPTKEGHSFAQTFAYNATTGELTSISAWVKV